MTLNDVLVDFFSLKASEQRTLFNQIQDKLFPKSITDIFELLPEYRQNRFSSGVGCLYCGSVAVKKNGKYRDRQRYLCKDCGKTFNDTTGSPLSGTRYPEKWLDFFQHMIEGSSLPKISEELEIHVSTAFYWRHKILFSLRKIGFEQLKGIIESDETFFLESQKGKKKVLGRDPRKRGGKANKRGISNEQVCVLVALDRNKHVFSGAAGNGRITAVQIDEAMGTLIDPSSLLCTDSAKNFMKFAQTKGLQHKAINTRRKNYVNEQIYHVQNVNSYHSRLKKWITRFQGVSSKYLDNYLYWFKFLEMSKTISKKNKTKELFLQGSKRINFCKVSDIKFA